ncbi:MAG TPA: S41 family peptidase [Gemmatimonas sp.]|nr:S41 family peptidase [Gemmatimonas sp.]
MTACAGRRTGSGSGPASEPSLSAANASAPNADSVGACQAPAVAAGSLADTPVTDPVVSFDSAWAIVARTHWDTTYNGVNWRRVREELRPKAIAAKTTGELRSVLNDMVGRLKQSHFSIIPRESSDGATSNTSTTATSSSASPSAGSGKEPGTIGVTLRLVDRSLLVTAIDDGSRAAAAGVKPGWTLEAVDGCPLAPRLGRIPANVDPRRRALLGYSIGAAALAGAAGDTVHAVFRDGANVSRALTLTRGPERGTLAKFGNLPPIPSYLEFERVVQGARTIGVIRFNIWMPVLAPQFDAAIDSLRDTDGIVLDIRGNFGGLGIMAAGFSGHFVDSARTIGTMYQRSGPMKFIANPRTVDTRARPVAPFSGPLAVVVDELSISTSEIFAAGIQVLRRGRIFGVQTAGQALPSIPERLPNGDILYHAIADFTSPDGKPVEGVGVRPDEVIPVTRKSLLEGKDPALDAAISWAAVTATAKRKPLPQ